MNLNERIDTLVKMRKHANSIESFKAKTQDVDYQGYDVHPHFFDYKIKYYETATQTILYHDIHVRKRNATSSNRNKQETIERNSDIQAVFNIISDCSEKLTQWNIAHLHNYHKTSRVVSDIIIFLNSKKYMMVE